MDKYKGIKKTADGFTMIELLVVIAMIGVIAAIAAPSWLEFLTQRRLSAASSDLMDVLSRAQQEAQSKQLSRSVIFSSTDLSVTVRNKAASTGGSVVVLGSGEVNDNFSMVTSTPSLVFDYDGQIEQDGVTFPVVYRVTNNASPSQSCVIVTTLLGGMKTAKGDECDTFSNSPF
ncbi:MAG: prepilin-type N-terminal cleavage/methylation domain-containing protein [Cyanobacteria bacterium J06621_3]